MEGTKLEDILHCDETLIKETIQNSDGEKKEPVHSVEKE